MIANQKILGLAAGISLLLLQGDQAGASIASGGGYTLESAVFGSGGSFSSTMGESVVGQSNGGAFENCSGFWCTAGPLSVFSSYTFLPGLNLFGYPVTVPADPGLNTALELLAEVAPSPGSGSVQQLQDSVYQVVASSDDQDFLLADGVGYLVYAQNPTTLTFTGVKQCAPLQLTAGTNLISLPCVPAEYTSYDLIQFFNSSDGVEVVSIQRFNRDIGRFESTSLAAEGAISGLSFPVIGGEAYFVNLRTAPDEVISFP